MNRKDKLIRVLLADDHAVVRVGIRDVLNQAGDIHVVAEAEDGEAARQLIRESQPDVLVLDIRLPAASGIEVARWARKNYPEMAILILSAYDDAPFLNAALQAGVNGYILKTASPEVIVQGIHDVCEGKLAFDSTMAQKVMGYVAGDSTSAPSFEPLTDRELEVLSLVGKGHTNKAIGKQLGISGRTVQGHLARIYKKLQANSRTEAVMLAVNLGLITVEIED
jgi:DNA-binding NarL/FixJ family response regulator